MTPSGLTIQLLGPMAILRGDEPLPLPTARKARALLAYLVVEGRPIERDALCALLWPDAQPDKARLSLRVALSQLRGAVPDRMISVDATLAFVPRADDRVDVRVLLGDGSEAWDPGEAEHVAQLYRGPLLDDLSDVDTPGFAAWLMPWRERLADRARAVLVHRAATASSRGRGDEAVTHLRRAAALDPLHEPTQGALILALGRAGSHAAALEQFERLRHGLAEELGVGPSAEVLAIRERVIAAHAREHRRSLPVPPTPFVGRVGEIDRILELLADPERLPVTIVGPGGIGKTRLAIEVASRLSASVLDGTRLVALAGLATGTAIGPSVAAELGLQVVGAAEPLEQVLEVLRDRELLLVLDNFETVSGQEAEVARLLIAGPGIRVLVTSREPLGLTREHVVRVGGLTYPDADGEPSRPDQYGAVALFAAAARRVDPDFAIERELDAVGAICRQVQGFPLALELAAPWIAEADCATIAARLASDLGGVPGAFGLPERHASLEAVFEHTWRLLSGAERVSFARLCVFRGGFDAEAAEAVAAVSGPQIVELRRRSLVSGDGRGRYAIHEVLRHFGAARLDHSAPLAERVRDAHARHYLARFAAGSARHGSDAREVVALVEADPENLQSAWRRAVERRDFAAVEPAAVDLAGYYYAQGPNPLGIALCDEVTSWFDAEGDDGSLVELAGLAARLIAERGFFALRAGDAEGARVRADRALELATMAGASGDTDEAASAALRLRGIVLRMAGDLDAAVADLEGAVTLARRAGSDRLAAEAAYHLAGIAVYRGDVASCVAGTRAVLDSVEGRGYQRLECALCFTLSVLQDRMGDTEAATASSRRCLDIAMDAGYRLGEMNAAAAIGVLLYRRGKLVEGMEHLERSIRLAVDLGHRATERAARNSAAIALAGLGRPAEAAFQLERSLSQARAEGAVRDEALARLRLAYVQRNTHDLATAAATAEAAYTAFQTLGDGANAAVARAEIGRCARLAGDGELAAAAFAEAIPVLETLGERTQWLTTRLDRARLDAPGVAVEGRLAEATSVRDAAAAAQVDALVPSAEVVRGRLLLGTDPAGAAEAFARALAHHQAAGLPHLAVEPAAALAACRWREGRTNEASRLATEHLETVFRQRLVGIEAPIDVLRDLLLVLEGAGDERAGEMVEWANGNGLALDGAPGAARHATTTP